MGINLEGSSSTEEASVAAHGVGGRGGEGVVGASWNLIDSAGLQSSVTHTQTWVLLGRYFVDITTVFKQGRSS